MLTPTVIQEDPGTEGNQRLTMYVAAEKEIAAEKKCQLVDLHGMFLTALKQKPAGQKGNWLTADGVHMKPLGDAIMATGALRRSACRTQRSRPPIFPDFLVATISEALTIAIQHHQAGRLQAAERIYRQILASRAGSCRRDSSSRRDRPPGRASTRWPSSTLDGRSS